MGAFLDPALPCLHRVMANVLSMDAWMDGSRVFFDGWMDEYMAGWMEGSRCNIIENESKHHQKHRPTHHPKTKVNLIWGSGGTRGGLGPSGIQVPKKCENGHSCNVHFGMGWRLKLGNSRQNRQEIAKNVVPRSTLKNIVRKVLHKRFLGTPLNPRNHYLHISTCTPKAIPSGLQWIPFGTPLVLRIW